MKKTRVSLLTSLVTLLLCSAMFVGSTFAWFTDTVSNTGNRIQAGTLKIDLLMDKQDGNGYKSIANGTGDIFKEATKAQNATVTLWEPGKTQFAYLAVENKGTLALKYNIIIDVTDEGLANSLEYAIIPTGHAPATTDPASLANWDAVKALANGLTGTVTAGRTTAAEGGVLDEIVNETKNERDYFILAVHMKEEAGNEYQGKDAIIDVCVVATQATAEKDGFDSNEYDAQAEVQSLPNPIHVEVETNETINKNTPSSGDEKASFTGYGAVKSAEVMMSTVKELLPEVGGTVDTHTVEESDSVDMKMNLKVDSTDVSEDSVTYDLSLFKTVTVTNSDSVKVAQEKSQVTTALTTPVTAVIQLESNLNKVVVKHSGTEMEKLATVDANPENIEVGGYFYNFTNGELTVKAAKFSPFTVSYKNVEGVACIVRGEEVIGYNTLLEALNDVQDGEAVVLLKTIENQRIWWAAKVGTYTLDLNGHDIIGETIENTTYTLHLYGQKNTDITIKDSSDKPGSIIGYGNAPYIQPNDGHNANGTLYIRTQNSGDNMHVTIEDINIVSTKGECAINDATVSGKESLLVKSGKIDGDIYLNLRDGTYVVATVNNNVQYNGETQVITPNPAYKLTIKEENGTKIYGIEIELDCDLYMTEPKNTSTAETDVASVSGGFLSYPTKHKSIKVNRNFSATSWFAITSNEMLKVTFDLNGKTVTTGTNEVCFVSNTTQTQLPEKGYNTFVICDKVGGGKITASKIRAKSAEVIITSGTFDINGFALETANGSDRAPGKITIQGGNFKCDPSAYVAEGFEAKFNSETGYYVVSTNN